MKPSSQQDTWSEDLQLPTSHGFLKHDILERICRLLPTQQDCYQACLINRAWRYPATNVLWESPIFRTPTSFKTFLKIINEKRLALNVKHLTLCLPDTTSSTLFESVNKCEQDRHTPKDNILSRPNVIHHVIQYCQQLTSLTVYGWNLEQHDFDKIYSYLPCLKNLKVIGTNEQLLQQTDQNQHSQQTNNNFQLNTYLPRLSQLVLDGLFPISRSFAQSIAIKAQNMTTLHLSLSSMNPLILSILCASDTGLDLKDLTLTHGIHMNDHFANKVLGRFSNLRKFRMEGTQYLTVNILRMAMENCPHLQHLEIRQILPGNLLDDGTDQEDWQLPNENGGDLRTLLVENLHLYNNTLENIAYYCPLLTSLGLSHTGADLTGEGIEAMRKASFGFLRHIYLKDCPMVTSEAMIYLPMSSLYTLHLESIGNIEPIDIFNICLQTVEEASENNLRPNLRQIKVVGHENIATSVVGTFAIENLDYQAKQWADEDATQDTLEPSNYQVTLDQQAIVSLAHSDEFIVVPSSKLLTGLQIVELAKKLQVPLNHLLGLLDELKEPETNDIPKAEEPKSRVDVLKKSSSQNLRPSTPALWAAATHDPVNLPPQKSPVPSTPYEQLNTLPTLSSHLQPENHSVSTTSDAVSSQSQTSDSEYDQTISEKEDWVHMETSESNTNISLGGWGTSDIIPWTKQKARTFSNVVAGTSSVKSSKIVKNSNNGNSNGGVAWGSTTEENYESYWRVTPVEEPPQLCKQKGRLTNLNVGSDHWGQANKYVNWKDTEPFVSDVLEDQSNTVYWERGQNGEWKPLQPTDQRNSSNDTTSKTRVDTGSDRKTTTARFSNGTTPSSFTRRSPTNPKHISNGHIDVNNATLNNSPTINNLNVDGNDSSNGVKDYSLSSDNSDVDWDDDDGITIKINASANIHQETTTSISARESKWSSTHVSKSSWKEKKDRGATTIGDKRFGQDSPVAAGGFGLTTNDTLDRAKYKPNEREPRTTRFARPKAQSTNSAPVALPTTNTPSPSPAYTPLSAVESTPNSCPTNRWQEFADNKKGKTTMTNASSLAMTDLPTTSSTSAEEDMTTELLVDTSDNTAVVGTTSWTPKEERSSLHDLYNSMADIQISDNGNQDYTMKQETLSWRNETNGRNIDQDDCWTINRDHIKENSDDIFLLLGSSQAVESTNNKDDTADIKPSDMEFVASSLLDTSTSAPTTPSESGKGASVELASLLDDHSLTTLINSPVDKVMLPVSTIDDILSSSDTITDMPDRNDTPITTLIDPASNDSHSSTSNHALNSTPSTSAAIDSLDTDEISGVSTHPNGEEEPFMKISIQIPIGLQEILFLYENQNPRINVHRFCERYGMLSSEDYIFANANKKYMEKKANILLGGLKKKKKKKKDKKEPTKAED